MDYNNSMRRTLDFSRLWEDIAQALKRSDDSVRVGFHKNPIAGAVPTTLWRSKGLQNPIINYFNGKGGMSVRMPVGISDQLKRTLLNLRKKGEAMKMSDILREIAGDSTTLNKAAEYIAEVENRSKIAEKLSYSEKQSIPAPQFAAVWRDKNGKVIKKYPVHDAAHVRNAIARWNQFKQDLPPSVRAEAARRIYNAAKRFGVEIHDPDILRSAGKSTKTSEDAVDEIMKRARMNYIDPTIRGEYKRLAKEAEAKDANPYEIARKLAALDLEAEIDRIYDEVLKDPVESVVAKPDKVAETYIKLDGIRVPVNSALKGAEDVKDRIGDKEYGIIVESIKTAEDEGPDNDIDLADYVNPDTKDILKLQLVNNIQSA